MQGNRLHVMPPQESLRSQFLVHCFISMTPSTPLATIDGNYVTLYANNMLLYRVIDNSQDFNNMGDMIYQ